jgi:hypothetical protein
MGASGPARRANARKNPRGYQPSCRCIPPGTEGRDGECTRIGRGMNDTTACQNTRVREWNRAGSVLDNPRFLTVLTNAILRHEEATAYCLEFLHCERSSMVYCRWQHKRQGLTTRVIALILAALCAASHLISGETISFLPTAANACEFPGFHHALQDVSNGLLSLQIYAQLLSIQSLRV